MDYLSRIKAPIAGEMLLFNDRFEQALSHADDVLAQALGYIVRRSGKRMRPMLTLLAAKLYGGVSDVTLSGAVGLELLHTASLVHDDVVDESRLRRGQASVNAVYDNKVAVLVGDYLLSTSLLHVSLTGSVQIVKYLASLGQTLAAGEIMQLSSSGKNDLSEQAYYDIISKKTAALFEACCVVGAMSAGACDSDVEEARAFGHNIGMIFQIRDDIFDYYPSADIGKPTGNDMAEGKLTLPILYALNNSSDNTMRQLAQKVKNSQADPDEVAQLVDFAKQNGGIDYAEQRMTFFGNLAQQYVDTCVSSASIRDAMQAYLNYVIHRKI